MLWIVMYTLVKWHNKMHFQFWKSWSIVGNSLDSMTFKSHPLSKSNIWMFENRGDQFLTFLMLCVNDKTLVCFAVLSRWPILSNHLIPVHTVSQSANLTSHFRESVMFLTCCTLTKLVWRLDEHIFWLNAVFLQFKFSFFCLCSIFKQIWGLNDLHNIRICSYYN